MKRKINYDKKVYSIKIPQIEFLVREIKLPTCLFKGKITINQLEISRGKYPHFTPKEGKNLYELHRMPKVTVLI